MSQDIELGPCSNHSDEYEEAILNPVPSNRPLQMPHEIQSDELENFRNDNNGSTALYLAAVAGNIETVKIMMAKNPSLDTIPGGGGDMMPLYAAVLFGRKDVAKYLYYECSENLEKDGWDVEKRELLLEKCVESDMFDIALKIVKKYRELGRSSYSNLLGLLARKPEAFHEKSERDALQLLRILWDDIVKLPKNDRDRILRGPPDSTESSLGRLVQTMQLEALIFRRLDELEIEARKIIKKGTQEVPELKDLVSKYVVDMHVKTQSLIKKEHTTDEDQALELQKLISEYVVKLHDETKKVIEHFEKDHQLPQKLVGLILKHISKMRAETEIRDKHSSRVMFIAAEVGNTNFLIELIRRQPDLTWQVDDNGLSIFHVAVKHRHEGIYNLLYEIGSMKDMVTPLTDKDGNNMLHLAAMSTGKRYLEEVSLAALQMQRELLWFMEVKRMIPPYLRQKKNKDGFTPRELFTIEHEDLIEQAKKSLKSMVNECMVVATVVATIGFAAAFTVLGEYNKNDGIPMFNRKLSFSAFVVVDAMSLFLSSASILTFLSILTSRYAERDFVASLPRKLTLGLVTVFLSIATMMVTFSASFFVLYHKEMKWMPIFISLLFVTPFTLYVVLQFHLLVDLVRSTYGGKYLFKPENQVLFYENPKV